MTCMKVNRSARMEHWRRALIKAAGSAGQSYLSVSGLATRTKRPRTSISVPRTVARVLDRGMLAEGRESWLVDDILFLHRVQSYQSQQFADVIKHAHQQFDHAVLSEEEGKGQRHRVRGDGTD